MVPAQNRPSGATLPSLNRVPGIEWSGAARNVAVPVSKSNRWNPSRNATTAPPDSRSPNEPIVSGMIQFRFSPVAGSRRFIDGA